MNSSYSANPQPRLRPAILSRNRSRACVFRQTHSAALRPRAGGLVLRRTHGSHESARPGALTACMGQSMRPHAPGDYSMATRMLTTCATRKKHAVLKGNRLRSSTSICRTQADQGNIYRRVTRVEPSLQAAFVDFGGNRRRFASARSIPTITGSRTLSQALLAEERRMPRRGRAARRGGRGRRKSRRRRRGYDEDEDLVRRDRYQRKDEVATIEDGRVDTAGRRSDEDERNEDEDREDERGDHQDSEELAIAAVVVVGSPPGGNRGRAKEMDELKAKRQSCAAATRSRT